MTVVKGAVLVIGLVLALAGAFTLVKPEKGVPLTIGALCGIITGAVCIAISVIGII